MTSTDIKSQFLSTNTSSTATPFYGKDNFLMGSLSLLAADTRHGFSEDVSKTVNDMTRYVTTHSGGGNAEQFNSYVKKISAAAQSHDNRHAVTRKPGATTTSGM